MEAPPVPYVQHPSPKFQHRYGRHVLLFLLTVVTTTWAGRPDGGSILSGLAYSLPMLAILGAHEFGHYYYCRRHDVNATLPFFLPAPLPLTGTLGAVIRIKEPFPNTRALFDIGVAGPIAGFITLLPFLYWGVTLSVPLHVPQGTPMIYFGEPLLYRLVAAWHFGPLPEGTDVLLHPMGFAAWFGMLATAMNLLPFGQLDGGHIAYSVFGPRSRYVSMVTLAVTILLTFRATSWAAMAVVMSAMAYFLGFGHPRVMDETEPLDAKRKVIALLALAIFVVCFVPVPIEMFFPGK